MGRLTIRVIFRTYKNHSFQTPFQHFTIYSNSYCIIRVKKFTDNWTVKRLGDLIQIRSGFSPSSFKLGPSGKFPFLKVEELNNSTKYQSESRFFTDERKNIVPRGSVIFPKRGAAILNNKVRISAVDVLLDSNLMAITPLEESLDAEFLYYKIYLDKLYKIADTSTIPQINNKHIEPYKIPLPTLPEQQKIASFLLAVDEKIQQLTRKKELLEQYKKGVMQQLFCLHYDSSDSGDGHDGLSNHGNQKNHSKSQFRQLRFKDENGKAYPKWEGKLYEDVFSFYSTNSFSRENLNYDSGEVKNIHYGDIHTKFSSRFVVNEETVPYINSSLDLTKVKDENYCREGDLVIADASEDYADIGKTIELIKLNNEKVVAGLHTFLARPNKTKMYKGFSGYLVQAPYVRKQVMTIAQGTKVLSLSPGRLGKVKLEIPVIEEQQKIASFLSAIDTKIESVATQIEKTQTFKKGLLQQMFV